MKIGIQVLAYNCHNTIEDVLNPWIEIKKEYDIKIWVSSGQFRIYKELGYEDKNTATLQLLKLLLDQGKIDFLHVPSKDSLLDDHSTRQNCISYFKENEIDLMIQLDSDEFYNQKEVSSYLKFIVENDTYSCYNTVFKNLIMDGNHYVEWERFSAAWIKRHGGISHYYFDQHWSFRGDDGNNVEYRWVPTISIPKELVHPIHDTWTNHRKGSGNGHIKSKIEYQEKYYSHQSGWKWNEETQCIEINESVWDGNIPEIKKLSN
jgi:hypothetical protein